MVAAPLRCARCYRRAHSAGRALLSGENGRGPLRCAQCYRRAHSVGRVLLSGENRRGPLRCARCYRRAHGAGRATYIPFERSKKRADFRNSLDDEYLGPVALCMLSLSKANNACSNCSKGKVHFIFHSHLSRWQEISDCLQSLWASPERGYKSPQTASTMRQNGAVSIS
jgi:hypothetical protein